ncbi:hypothetical protein T07_13626 [Trichinella nelsoni]|uniref:Uncharacterized protein n=1 Tax=Trichinella nelsoni TaxID=6336 RepID=A0A0V0RPA8_9BILA|nr:hypothetical protein T07_13626 [Trichinella nelsoni]
MIFLGRSSEACCFKSALQIFSGVLRFLDFQRVMHQPLLPMIAGNSAIIPTSFHPDLCYEENLHITITFKRRSSSSNTRQFQNSGVLSCGLYRWFLVNLPKAASRFFCNSDLCMVDAQQRNSWAHKPVQILLALFVHRLRYLQLTGNDLLHCAFLFNDVSSHWQNANNTTRRVISVS